MILKKILDWLLNLFIKKEKEGLGNSEEFILKEGEQNGNFKKGFKE